LQPFILHPPIHPAKDVKKLPDGFAHSNEYGATYFLYVTYWTCLLEAVYLAMAFLTALFPRHRAIYRTTWVLRTITAPTACLVALLYWTLIFPATGVTDYVDASIHGCVSVSVFAASFSCARPWRLHTSRHSDPDPGGCCSHSIRTT
jgi:hypothetical protein